MEQRRYTVDEINALRSVLETKWLFGTARIQSGPSCSRVFYGDEKDRAVEALVQTHMLAGHTAADIYNADRPPMDTGTEPRPSSVE